MAQIVRYAKWIDSGAPDVHWRPPIVKEGEMFDQTGWMVLGVAVVVAALIGFLVGRMGAGSKSRVSELEAEVARHKDELSGYKRDVEAHFDKTAALFVSMAGSYKELVEHLSSSYHKLGEDGSRELFRDRFSGLLVTAPTDEGQRDLDVAVEAAPEAAPTPEEAVGPSASPEPVAEGAVANEPEAPAGTETSGTPEAGPAADDGAVAPVTEDVAQTDALKKDA
jgi:uncharacterized membrane-anchored protein YhcB (DUF1043 family)